MDLVKSLENYQAALLEACETPQYTKLSTLNKVRELLKLTARILNASRVSAWRYSDDKSEIVCVNLYRQDTNQFESGARLGVENYPAYFEAMAKLRVVVANDARTHPATIDFAAGYLEPLGIYSMVDTPIYASNSQHGVLCIEDDKSGRIWRVDEISFIMAIADKISLAIEHQAWLQLSKAVVKAERTDTLTGLENRLAFQERLEKSLIEKMSELSVNHQAVMLIGLDKFSDLNDQLGFSQANELLKSVANQLSAICQIEEAFVARFSGDTFIIWVPDLQIELKSLVRRLHQAIDSKCILPNSEAISISACIGASIISSEVNEVDTSIREAEIALGKAKQIGAGNTAIFDSNWHSELKNRRSREKELLDAIENDELVPYYQPIIETSSKEIKGVEVLIRWQHPEKGTLSPFHFLPLAAEMQIMPRLGDYLLRHVLKDISHSMLLKTMEWVSINLSPEQLYSNTLIANVTALFDEYGTPKNLIEFEIVEDLISHDASLVLDQFKAIDKLGIQLSIDDFGTGYSSLSRLKHMPVSKLKIDRSFVRGLPEDESDKCIASSIIGMAKGLNLKIVAEGVEDEEQAQWLIANGCDFIQGYLYAKPMPLKQLVEFVFENEAGHC